MECATYEVGRRAPVKDRYGARVEEGPSFLRREGFARFVARAGRRQESSTQAYVSFRNEGQIAPVECGARISTRVGIERLDIHGRPVCRVREAKKTARLGSEA